MEVKASTRVPNQMSQHKDQSKMITSVKNALGPVMNPVNGGVPTVATDYALIVDLAYLLTTFTCAPERSRASTAREQKITCDIASLDWS